MAIVEEKVLIKGGRLGWKVGEVEYCVGDRIEISSLLCPNNRYKGKIVFESGCFSLLIEKIIKEQEPEYDVNQIIPLREFNLNTVKKE